MPAPDTAAPRWVDTARRLAKLVDDLATQPVYALDTEFHRERSYYPRLALVQVAWEGGIAVVDPLAVEIAPLRRVLEGPGLAICHAAEQDLEVLQRACGVVPARLFDTQTAAAFLGFGFASLARLVQAVTGNRIAKGDRLTDWTKRPLDDAQIAYAASDVEHLIHIWRDLCERAETKAPGTLGWIEEECERARTRENGPIAPETAWWRIKGSRSLRGRSRGVAQEVAAWRERTAAKRDIPPRFVLPDLALAVIAQRPPRALKELREVRGLDARYLKGGAEEEVWRAIETGQDLATTALRLPPNGEPSDDSLGPSVALGLALVAQIAAERSIEPSLIANRADVLALASGRRNGRLSKGWRSEVAGKSIKALLGGKAALAGDGRGGVKLVEIEHLARRSA